MPSFRPRFVRELTLRRRLVITLACMALVLVLPAFYAIERLDEIRDIAFELKGRHGAAEVALSRLEADLGQVEASLRSYVADPSPESRAGTVSTSGSGPNPKQNGGCSTRVSVLPMFSASMA